ncbi:MAG TPA: hypothetical protein VMA35_04100 [Candidatus Sulfopaludibacter sp.]|nr:hypothetical protein [Candidatus Sulfopaludibacter sp.]
MNRIVQPELLDELPIDDPRAVHSRRDLRRVNAWMRNHAIMANALRNQLNGRSSGRQTATFLPAGETSGSLPRAATPVLHIADLGAGDGNFLLRVARVVSGNEAPFSDLAWHDSGETCRPGARRPAASGGVRATLIDRQKNVTSRTLASFTPLGWRAESVAADVFDWLPTAHGQEVIVANLFLHHLQNIQLAELFRAVAERARLFVAIEPRRSPWTAFWCRWLWLIGCNSVTRHDAAISVRAGFSGQELSALWPADPGWELTERRTGFFSHLFVARKVSPLECADMSALSKAATCRRSPK